MSRSDKEIEAALASNWIAVPFGDPKSKHNSDLPRKLARRLHVAEQVVEVARTWLEMAEKDPDMPRPQRLRAALGKFDAAVGGNTP